MRWVILDSCPQIPEMIFRLGLTEGVVCPRVRVLALRANFHNLPFYRFLISPKLTSLTLAYSSFPPKSMEEELSIIQPVIMGLETFPLQRLNLKLDIPGASGQMEPVISSAVLRCGPALKDLFINSPLSDAAVQHIMQLPNLDAWATANGPPRTPNLSPSNIFPRLHDLSLASEASLEWLTLFTKTTRRIPSGHNSYASPNRGPVQRLTRLVVHPRVPIDAVFMTPIMLFRELIFLSLTPTCSPSPTATAICTFSLTDGDVAEIAAALPRLQEARFGIACRANSCKTTVASLISFSTSCRNLKYLMIHVNTTNLRNDLESVSTDSRLDSLPSLRTRNNFCLFVSGAPFTISEDEVAPMLKGFRRIFPSLTQINWADAPWKELNIKLQELVDQER